MKKIIFIMIITFLFLSFIFFKNFFFNNSKKLNCDNCKILTGCNKVELMIDTLEKANILDIQNGTLKLYTNAKVFCNQGIVKVKSISILTGEVAFAPLDSEQFIEISYPNEKPRIIYSTYREPEGSEGIYRIFLKLPNIFFQTDDSIFFDFICRKYNIENRVLEIVSKRNCNL